MITNARLINCQIGLRKSLLLDFNFTRKLWIKALIKDRKNLNHDRFISWGRKFLDNSILRGKVIHTHDLQIGITYFDVNHALNCGNDNLEFELWLFCRKRSIEGIIFSIYHIITSRDLQNESTKHVKNTFFECIRTPSKAQAWSST